MSEILVADIETNGLRPDTIYMVGVLNLETEEYTAYIGDEVPLGLMRLAEAECVIGHNFIGYDAPVIENLTDGLIKIDKEKIIDTCDLSRRLFPLLPSHKLKVWGEIFGDEKIEYDKGFHRYHPDMVPYLEQDVRLTTRLFRFLSEQSG